MREHLILTACFFTLFLPSTHGVLLSRDHFVMELVELLTGLARVLFLLLLLELFKELLICFELQISNHFILHP